MTSLNTKFQKIPLSKTESFGKSTECSNGFELKPISPYFYKKPNEDDQGCQDPIESVIFSEHDVLTFAEDARNAQFLGNSNFDENTAKEDLGTNGGNLMSSNLTWGIVKSKETLPEF
jgi:hypothetical protein